MFGGGSGSSKADGSSTTSIGATDAAGKTSPTSSPSAASAGAGADPAGGSKSPSPDNADAVGKNAAKGASQPSSGEKRSGNGSSPASASAGEQKKRRSSGVSSKASSLLASAKNTLNFATQAGSRTTSSPNTANQSPLQKLGKQDPALAVPQGQHNNSAGESLPGPRSTFRVGVWEDRNKKCRRTMEDTHAFLYNFLHTPSPASGGDNNANPQASRATGTTEVADTDNGYFAIFDGHAGTFAADWCGKKLHLILEETIRKNPNVPIPELLDQTFTTVDAQLEKLPVKNSGCTAAIAVLRWEDRIPSGLSATGSQPIGAARPAEDSPKPEDARAKASISRQRVLYTANVGDARIILCRSGKALRLSYDHKGSDENEGKRIANAGGLILNNRVNGVLAVTRALGDTYMKDLVTGHPYTTETVIQPELDEFMIIACDGLWDVCDDQEAVNQVRNIRDPAAAAKLLVEHALERFSTDNLSCMVVRFDKQALVDGQASKEPLDGGGDESEADRIVNTAKREIAEGVAPAVGVSASSNAPHGNDIIPSITEEPSAMAEQSPKGTQT